MAFVSRSVRIHILEFGSFLHLQIQTKQSTSAQVETTQTILNVERIKLTLFSPVVELHLPSQLISFMGRYKLLSKSKQAKNHTTMTLIFSNSYVLHQRLHGFTAERKHHLNA